MYVIIYTLAFGSYFYKEANTIKELDEILNNKNANVEKIYKIEKELKITVKV